MSHREIGIELDRALEQQHGARVIFFVHHRRAAQAVGCGASSDTVVTCFTGMLYFFTIPMGSPSFSHSMTLRSGECFQHVLLGISGDPLLVEYNSAVTVHAL